MIDESHPPGLAPSTENSLRSPFPGLPRPVPSLEDRQAHVWTVLDSPASTSAYAALLSPGELQKASGFRFQSLAERYIADHGRLRLLLGAYLDAAPSALTFTTNQFGKPSLPPPHSHLRFNLSHSGKLTAFAVCREAELGIDVESVRPVEEWEAIASTHFSAGEIRAIQAEKETDRTPAFFRCWTRKESFLKAKGTGLSIALDSFGVSVTAGSAPALISCAWDERELDRWSMFHLEPEPGFVGCLTLEGRAWSTLHLRWAGGNAEP